jgi:hypothetical protein
MLFFEIAGIAEADGTGIAGALVGCADRWEKNRTLARSDAATSKTPAITAQWLRLPIALVSVPAEAPSCFCFVKLHELFRRFRIAEFVGIKVNE